MSTVSELVGDVASTAAKPMLPWLIAIGVFVLALAGLSGMYAGYEIANGRFAKDQLAMAAANTTALQAKDAALQAAYANSNEVSDTFLKALKSIRIVNKTFNNEVQREVQKLVYTDCKLPDSGMAILSQHISAINSKFDLDNLKPVPAPPKKDAKK